MTTMTATTTTTCGPACWNAPKPDCRCSCGGTSHGVTASGDGLPPRRNCVIGGTRYLLGSVSYAVGAASDFAYPWHRDHDRTVPAANGPRSVTWAKLATEHQVDKWPEVAAAVAAYVERMSYGGRTVRPRRPYLIWIREDAAADFDAWQAAGEPRR